MTIAIKSITPKQEQNAQSNESPYRFELVLVDECGQEHKIHLHAESLFNYQKFAVIVLEKTGRLHGDGTYQSWPGEIRKHLNAFWATVKRDKAEPTQTWPVPCVGVPIKIDHRRPARQQVEELEPFPLPPDNVADWTDPGVGQAVS